MDEPAEPLHIPLTSLGNDRTSGKEEQAFKNGMIERMQESGGHRERSSRRHRIRLNARANPNPTKTMPTFSTVL